MRIILLILSLYIHNSFASNITIVRAEKILTKEFSSHYTAIGLCKEELSREYTAKVEGIVDNILLSNNQRVKKGELILTIDQIIAEATKDKATEIYNATIKSYQRDESLFKQGILSKEAMDNSKVALENAKLDLALALKQYEDMIITAPFDGILGVIYPQIGDNIKLGDYLFTLISPGNKNVIVELPENLYQKITLQSEVFVKDIDGKQIPGKIIAISDYLKSNGTLSAKLLFPKNANILHGSYVTTNFVFNPHIGLAINSKALLKNNTGNFVYKIDQGKVKQIYVETGLRNGTDIEISSPELSIGDLIVTEGLTKISEGSLVTINSNSY
ncbi:MAG: efflux RND transporter periplasmic adaptor subunit [Rickettsiaceae bacterium]|nr:efflux RND transporter periplasmic adaptor subunit [Rickettsiaceae bacterium]